MKRVIVDYSKLTSEILNLLVEKFPDGYDDSDIVRFKNAKNEAIEAVEVRTEDTIYLVKVSTKLADRIENYDEDEELEGGAGEDSLDALKELEIEDGTDDDDADDNDSADTDDDEDSDDDEPSDEGDSDDEDDE